MAYARARGVEVSAYTLMQHNGWGETIPLAEQTLGRDLTTRGPTACFATDWRAGHLLVVVVVVVVVVLLLLPLLLGKGRHTATCLPSTPYSRPSGTATNTYWLPTPTGTATNTYWYCYQHYYY